MLGAVVSPCAMAGPAGSTANTNPTDKTPFHGLNMNTLCKSKNPRTRSQLSLSGPLKSTIRPAQRTEELPQGARQMPGALSSLLYGVVVDSVNVSVLP